MIFRYNVPIYKHDSVFLSEKGSDIIPKYVLDFPERGGVCLKKVGEHNIYEVIQANLENCDLSHVLESCVHSNQFAVCNEDNLNTLVADFTTVNNLADLYSGVKRIENTWLDLPLEVRENFDSDIKKFVRTIGSDEFADKVSSGYERFHGNITKNLSTTIPVPGVNVPDDSLVNNNASMKLEDNSSVKLDNKVGE